MALNLFANLKRCLIQPLDALDDLQLEREDECAGAGAGRPPATPMSSVQTGGKVPGGAGFSCCRQQYTRRPKL